MIAPGWIAGSSLGALALESAHLLPLVAALVAAVGVGVVTLYLPQARAQCRRWRWAMAGLRIAALSALSVSILQPVIHRPPRPEDLGAVVVIVDHSRGMGVTDRQRTPAQLVALADGLGRLPPGARFHTDDFAAAARQAGEQLDQLSAVVAEISFARMRGLDTTDAAERLAAVVRGFDAAASSLTARRLALRPKSAPVDALAALQKSLDALRGLPLQAAPDRAWTDAARAALDRLTPAIESLQAAEDSRLYYSNKQVRTVCDELHGLNRLGLVEQALVAPDGGLLSTLPPRVPVFGFAAAASTDPLPLQSEHRPVRRLALDAGGPPLPSGAAVRAALDHLRGVPVQAVVLFSGGHETPGAAPVASGVPVFAVSAAPQIPGRDLSITILDAPQEAAVGETVTVRVRVHGVNVRGTPVEIRFSAGPPRTPPPLAPGPQAAAIRAAVAVVAAGEVDVVSRRVVLGDDGTATVSFTTAFQSAGAQPLTLRVADLAGEITTANNAAERRVKVIGGKTRVALLAGSPGWDFRYLRDLLEANPRYAVTTEVLAEGAGVALSPGQLLSQDLIVLYDLPCAAMTADRWSAVRRVAAERGGGVVLIAGPDHLPMERDDAILLTTENDRAVADYLMPGPATDLLPFVLDKGADGRQEVAANWHVWEGQDPIYQFLPPPVTSGDAKFQLADTPLENARRWDSLPPVYTYLAMPPLKPAAHPLLVERSRAAPLVTEHALGGGHVLFVGTPETFRWRSKVGGRDYERIWAQLLGRIIEAPYAATGSDGTQRYSLDVPAEAQPRQGIAVRARVCGTDGAPISTDGLRARLSSGGKEAAILPLAPSAGSPGRFTATLPPLARGEYSVELLPPGKTQAVAAYPLHVASHDELEAQDVAGDRAALSRLAESSDGELLSLEQVNTLPARLEAHRLRKLTSTTLPLWDSGYLFLFVLGCLAAEWSLRKRAGLA